MRDRILYRYTTNGEGVFSAGKRLLPDELVSEIDKIRGLLPKPNLPKGEYRFYLKYKGKKVYLKKYYPIHKKYLENITLEKISYSSIKHIFYEDEYQVVDKIT